MDIINEEEKKYYLGDSDIEGTGVFASKNLKKGDTIGLIHTINKLYDDYDFEDLGKYHNHSDTPNCFNKLISNKRYLVTSTDIEKDTELTSNYRLQPDLEQPEHFKS